MFFNALPLTSPNAGEIMSELMDGFVVLFMATCWSYQQNPWSRIQFLSSLFLQIERSTSILCRHVTVFLKESKGIINDTKKNKDFTNYIDFTLSRAKYHKDSSRTLKLKLLEFDNKVKTLETLKCKTRNTKLNQDCR